MSQQCFKNLTHLDLFNNDVCNVDDYRAKMFKMLPSLKFLDDADADGNEAEDSDADEGQNGTLDDEDGSDEDGEPLFHLHPVFIKSNPLQPILSCLVRA